MASGVKDVFEGIREVLEKRKATRQDQNPVERIATALEVLADETSIIRTELALIRMANLQRAQTAGQQPKGAPIRVPVEPGVFSPRAQVLLRVHGESMRDAGIFNGDLLAVHRTPVAESGQIVVARLDDEITVKRLRLRETIAELLPANSAYAPIRIDLNRQELVIEGRAVGLIRAGDMARNL